MARPKKYVVTLTEEQRTFLQSLRRKGRASARVLPRARILLLAAEGRSNGFIAEALQVKSCDGAQHGQALCSGRDREGLV